MIALAELDRFDPRPSRSGGQARYRCPSPECDGKRGQALAVDPATGAYLCHRCQAAGRLVEFQDARAARQPIRVTRKAPKPPKPPLTFPGGTETPSRAARRRLTIPTERRWSHATLDGRKVAHVRIDRPDGTKDGPWWERAGRRGLDGIRPHDLRLYGIGRVSTRPRGSVVYVVEGEPAADALESVGVPAVATLGTGVTPTDEVIAELAGYVAVLWPDSDADSGGERHMDAVAAVCKRVGVVLSGRVNWAAYPGGDAADFVLDHGDQAAQLLEAALPALALGKSCNTAIMRTPSMATGTHGNRNTSGRGDPAPRRTDPHSGTFRDPAPSIDPRPDLTADSERWERLLRFTAGREDATAARGLHAALLGARCMGAALVTDEGAGRRALEPEPATLRLVPGEADPAAYADHRREYLLPHADALRDLFRELAAASMPCDAGDLPNAMATT